MQMRALRPRRCTAAQRARPPDLSSVVKLDPARALLVSASQLVAVCFLPLCLCVRVSPPSGHSDGTARMPYTALVNDKDYGYGRMLVANSTAIQWQFLRSADNSVADSIWIYKQH